LKGVIFYSGLALKQAIASIGVHLPPEMVARLRGGGVGVLPE
jgi:hypothetical protein